jgi:uncharacterized membrane protein
MTVRAKRSDKLRAFLIVEFVLVLIALVIPVTPDKTGAPFVFPPDLPTYLKEVLIAFALGHAVMIVLAVTVWMYVRIKNS